MANSGPHRKGPKVRRMRRLRDRHEAAERPELGDRHVELVRLEAYKAAAETSPTFKQHGICVLCRKWKAGTSYSAHQGSGPASALLTRHVCFECVATKECGS